jgi:hypothetical protein
MNELWMWEFEGKQEHGLLREKRVGDYNLELMDQVRDEKGVLTFHRKRSDVTNLRRAKVVNADAVVSDE